MKDSKEMRRWMAVLLTVLLTVLLSGESRGQVGVNPVDWGVEPLGISRVGSAGWQFLKLPTDARSAAMGGVKSSVSYGNANSAFNNPASASDVRGMDVQFSSMKWVADIRYNSLSFVDNLGPYGTVGVHAIYLNYGDMIRTVVGQGTDALGNDLGIVPITEGLGSFTAHDLAAGLLYSRQITEYLQVGGTVRYLEQQIDDAKMRSWALDIGTMYKTGIGSLRISMLGKNFGADGQYLSYEGRLAQAPAKVKMPMMFIFGVAYDVLEMSKESEHRLTVAAEYVKPNDGPDKFNLGIEYFAMSNIYVRGGYRFNYNEESFTLGFGLEYSVSDDMLLKADYAYARVGRFSSVSMFTLGFGF
jgi:hypothetical protein